MDVVALAQLGVPNAVATLGTACSATHVQKLLRQTDRVVFSFDGDAAGRKAAWRALEASLPLAADNKELAFLFLPAEHDPDSYIREFGTDAFKEQVRAAMPLSGFLCRELATTHDLSAPEGRAKAQFDAKPLLRALPAGALRAQIVRELARMTQSSPEELSEFAELPRAEPMRGARRPAPPRSKRHAPTSLEGRVYQLLLGFPELVTRLQEQERALLESLEPGPVRELLDACSGVAAQGGFAGVTEVLTRGPEAEFFADLIRQVMQAPTTIVELDEAEGEMHAALSSLQVRAIQAELEYLAGGGLSDPADVARYRALMAEQGRLRQLAINVALEP